jgi:2,4-didehydro-3-deoxy-L-rhamnonate hydrolase
MASLESATPRFTLATITTATGPKAAISINKRIYPLVDVQPAFGAASVKKLLQDWPAVLPKIEAIVKTIAETPASFGIEQDTAQLLSPVLYPDNLLAVGANYADHLKEMGLAVEKWPSMPFFLRPPISCLVGPGETVKIPNSTKQFDWECELAVVLGKKLRNASRQEAESAIAGYTVGLDLSCRDLIKTDNDLKIDLVRGKAQDTMAPCGPVVVPKQFMPDIENLEIRLFVNGVQMMNGSTKEMLYKCDEQLSVISQYITLQPGDILFTGSPSGSAGAHGNCWLQPGDHIHAQIDGIEALDVWMQRK